MQRLVGALDDFGGAIEFSNPIDELVIRLPTALGDEDVAGTSQISRRLTQRPAWQHELVSKRRLSIDQHDIEPMFQVKILQPVIEE